MTTSYQCNSYTRSEILSTNLRTPQDSTVRTDGRLKQHVEQVTSVRLVPDRSPPPGPVFRSGLLARAGPTPLPPTTRLQRIVKFVTPGVIAGLLPLLVFPGNATRDGGAGTLILSWVSPHDSLQ